MMISSVKSRQILDSRGTPTIEVDVFLKDGYWGRAAVPSGASCGKNEALEIRDGDNSQYGGKGVKKAIANINNIILPNIIGKFFLNQGAFDHFLIELDGTENKSKLGANTILALSLAYAKACASKKGIPFFEYVRYCYNIEDNDLKGEQIYSIPRPMINIINGGSHADNEISFQEFMIVPNVACGFQEAMMKAVEIFHTLKYNLKKKGYSTNIGDEGGYAPMLKSCRHALDFLLDSIMKSGYRPGKDVNIALDIAANEFYKDGKYYLKEEDLHLTSAELILFYEDLLKNYPIISIEDPFYEEDFMAWQHFTQEFKNKVQIIGDDVFVTNTRLLSYGIENGIANAILIKPNQIGTLSETIAAVKLARDNNYNTIISHRSGETEDTTISHLAVALSNQIKTGSVCRTDRVCKYNELFRIEEMLLKQSESSSGEVKKTELG